MMKEGKRRRKRILRERLTGFMMMYIVHFKHFYRCRTLHVGKLKTTNADTGLNSYSLVCTYHTHYYAVSCIHDCIRLHVTRQGRLTKLSNLSVPHLYVPAILSSQYNYTPVYHSPMLQHFGRSLHITNPVRFHPSIARESHCDL